MFLILSDLLFLIYFGFSAEAPSIFEILENVASKVFSFNNGNTLIKKFMAIGKNTYSNVIFSTDKYNIIGIEKTVTVMFKNEIRNHIINCCCNEPSVERNNAAGSKNQPKI